MIASELLSRMLRKASLEHPAILQVCCINSVEGKHICDICCDTCEHGVYDNESIHYEKCINCNRCSAICPTRAILPSPLTHQTLETIISSLKNDIYLQCRKNNKYSDIDVECIASLPWEIYIALSTKGRVSISIAKCEGCLHQNNSRALIAELHERVDDAYFINHFTILTDELDENLISRREMLSFMKTNSVNTISFFVSKNNQSPNELAYRTFLSQALLNMKDGIGNTILKMYRPLNNDNCWGCGLCESYCPKGAIKLNNNGTNPTISFKPWLCVQCKSCIKKCPEHAINGFEPINCDAQIEYEVKFDINYHYCKNCGNSQKPMENHWFCYYCGNVESMRA